MMTSHESTPDSVRLMHAWLAEGMGETGITFPFLAGALALRHSRPSVSESELRTLLQEMVDAPVPGYFVGIRMCSNIQAPVLSSLKLNDQFIKECVLLSPTGQVAVAFSPNAMSSLGGLACSDGADCSEKLIRYSTPHTEVGHFSRVYDPRAGAWTYSAFQQKELEFIQRVLQF